MKNLYRHISCCLALLLPAMVSGQSYVERSFDYFFQTWVLDAVPHPQGGLVIGGSIDAPILFHINPSGDTVNTRIVDGNGAFYYLNNGYSGTILSSNAYIWCDVVAGEDLERSFPNLDTMWKSPIQALGPLIELPDSTILSYSFANQGISVLNFNGSLKPQAVAFSPNNYAIKFLPKGNEDFIFLDESSIYVGELDTSFGAWNYLKTEFPFSGILIDFEEDEFGGFVLAREKDILRLDSSFLPIDTVELNTSYQEIVDISSGPEGVWVAGKSLGGLSLVTHLDNAFNLASQFSFSDTKTELSKIVKADSLVYVLGNERIGFLKKGFVKAFSPFTGDTDTTFNDAGVTMATIDSAVIKPYDVKIKCTATVKNYGTTILNEVDLNIILSNGPFCLHEEFFAHFDSLGLGPGQSKVVDLGWMQSMYMFIDINQKEICVFTTSPNRKVDHLHSNDAFCVPDLLIPRGQEFQLAPLEVFPNPCNGSFTLRLKGSNAGIKGTLKLHDLFGRKIWQGEWMQNPQTIELPPHIGPGVYLIQMNGEMSGRSILETKKLTVW